MSGTVTPVLLQCSQNIKGPGRFFHKAFLKMIDYDCIPYCLLQSVDDIYCSVRNKPTKATALFNIKVKSIQDSIPKWARTERRRIVTKCSPEKLGKFNGGSFRFNLLTALASISIENEDFLTPDWGIFRQLMTACEKLHRDSADT